MQVLTVEDLLADAFLLGARTYQNSSAAGLQWAHAEAASRLAQVVRKQRDFDYAIALSGEALAYFSAAGMHDMVANEYAMRGWAHHDSPNGNAQQAERDFVASLDAAGRAGNRAVMAYANTGLCESRVRAGRLAEAATPCNEAYRTLADSGDVGEFAAGVALAYFLLENGDARRAVGTLAPLLSEMASQQDSASHVLALETMARAHDRPATPASAALRRPPAPAAESCPRPHPSPPWPPPAPSACA